jgi:hypothetical protein
MPVRFLRVLAGARAWHRGKMGAAFPVEMWDKPPPPVRTHDSILAHQRQGQEAKTEKQRQERHFKGLSALGKVPGMDLAKRVYADEAHELMNVLKHALLAIYNRTVDGKVKYGKKEAEQERAAGRNISAEWIAEKGACKALDKLLAMFKNPSCWPKTRKTFEDLKRLKTAECLLLCGDAGCYLLREALPGDNKIREHFIALMRIMEMYVAHHRCAHTRLGFVHTGFIPFPYLPPGARTRRAPQACARR